MKQQRAELTPWSLVHRPGELSPPVSISEVMGTPPRLQGPNLAVALLALLRLRCAKSSSLGLRLLPISGPPVSELPWEAGTDHAFGQLLAAMVNEEQA